LNAVFCVFPRIQVSNTVSKQSNTSGLFSVNLRIENADSHIQAQNMRLVKLLKKTTLLKILVMALIILVPIFSFYLFVGPEFEISISQTWGRATHDTTEIKTLVAVNNPTPLSRWLKKIEFDLYINDLKIASEVSEKNVEVKPMGKTETELTSFLNNSKILDLWVSYLDKSNFFDVRLDGNVTFSSAVRELMIPISYETYAHTNLLELLNIHDPRDIRVGPADLKLKSLTSIWGDVTTDQTGINSAVEIYNPSNYTIKITKVNCTMEMNGIKLVENAVSKTINLMASRGTNVSFTWTLNNAMLNEWWRMHLENDQITRVAFNLRGTAMVAGAEYSFPFAEAAEDVSIRILSGTISFGYYVPVL